MEKSTRRVSIDLSQKNKFQENGYLTLTKFSNSEEIEHLLSQISQFKDDLGIRKKKTVYAIRNLLDDEAIKEFANSEKVLTAVESLLAEKVHPVRAIYFDKTQDSNWFVNWHQDLSIAIQKSNPNPATNSSLKAGEVHIQAPQDILENMLTLRLHLDNCDENNGPLQVIPASHKYGIIPPENLKEVSLKQRHLCKAEAGDALFMKPLLLHSSSKSVDVKHRRILHVEFCAEYVMSSIDWRWS